MAYAYPEDVHRLYIISYGIPVCPQGSEISANLMKSFKMTNFAPCGPIFKIRNSKLVYSKSYNQITDYIFLITSTFRLLLCYFVHFYTQRSRILKNQHCRPTVHWFGLAVTHSKCFRWQWKGFRFSDSRVDFNVSLYF